MLPMNLDLMEHWIEEKIFTLRFYSGPSSKSKEFGKQKKSRKALHFDLENLCDLSIIRPMAHWLC
jgi:hypothetical protein